MFESGAAIKLAIVVLAISSMFGLGLKINRKELGSLKESGPIVLGAFLLNFLILPVIAIFLGKWFALSYPIALGIFLCASSPGGASGGLFVLKANGNPAIGGLLIATLNAANTFITPFLFAQYTGGGKIEINVLGYLLGVSLVVQGLPLLSGLISRLYLPKLSEKVLPWVEKLSTVALVISILLLAFAHASDALLLGWNSWVVAALLIVIALSAGTLFIREARSVQASVSMVTGVRSLSLALLIAELYVNQPETLLTILMYGLLMYILTWTVSLKWKDVKAK
ncbi:bile acid:sodium symporter [Leptospira perolatii]|uniref:Bile acid:sodium symporter n=1 Tax=Leptospira perolatii TaxID=2023191 RepID=A0A2M9ZSA6_9LEPT|nr:bile acid:sodium symporter [Leptospira perolatii]PJZ71444.1 bile acid:sodium symporter [Leptospira perolatii]PJZ74978.1 bile acid:sodium symporter [Leptospira perolatii]